MKKCNKYYENIINIAPRSARPVVHTDALNNYACISVYSSESAICIVHNYSHNNNSLYFTIKCLSKNRDE